MTLEYLLYIPFILFYLSSGVAIWLLHSGKISRITPYRQDWILYFWFAMFVLTAICEPIIWFL